jgi:Zn-dependent protease with chaperone function
MITERIDELSSREFLQEVLKTPYPLGERVKDLAASVIEVIINALTPSFLDPFATLVDTIKVFSDYEGMQHEMDYDKITAEKVQQYFENRIHLFLSYDGMQGEVTAETAKKMQQDSKDKEDAIKKKLLFIIETTHELAKKMGVANAEVFLYDSLEELEEEEGVPPLVKKDPAGGGVCTGRSMILLKFEEIKEWDEHQLRFVIAHELAHIQHQDTLKSCIFDWTVCAIKLLAFGYFNALGSFGIGVAIQGISNLIQLGIDLIQDENEEDEMQWQKPAFHVVTLAVQAAVFWYFGTLGSFGLGIVMQGVAGVIRNTFKVYREQAADDKAMQVLNSNTEAISLFSTELKSQFRLKHTAAQKTRKDHPELSENTIIKLKQKFTPHGDIRIGHTHPTYTQRLCSALNFKPKPQPATAPAA